MLLGFLVIVLSKVDVWRRANFKAFLKTMGMWYSDKTSSWKLRKLVSSPASSGKITCPFWICFLQLPNYVLDKMVSNIPSSSEIVL